MNDFQERLQELLEERSLSRFQLAETLNITSTTINGYFNKNYYPAIDIALKFSKYFNCSLDYLFGLSNERHTKYHVRVDDVLINFNRNFKQLIKENNLTVAKAMRELGMSEYNYYRWQAGKFPKTYNLLTIAQTFEVGLDWLLSEH